MMSGVHIEVERGQHLPAAQGLRQARASERGGHCIFPATAGARRSARVRAPCVVTNRRASGHTMTAAAPAAAIEASDSADANPS